MLVKFSSSLVETVFTTEDKKIKQFAEMEKKLQKFPIILQFLSVSIHFCIYNIVYFKKYLWHLLKCDICALSLT